MPLRFKDINKNNPLIVAEILDINNGEIKKYKKLIDQCKANNINNIKLEIFRSSDLVESNHKGSNFVKKQEFSEKEWDSIFNYCNKLKMNIFCEIFSNWAFDFIKKYKISGVKINSGQLTNIDLVKRAASLNKILILGLDARYNYEIHYILGQVLKKKSKIIITFGDKNFDIKIDNNYLNRITEIFKEYSNNNVKIGSNYTLCNLISLEYIEKYFSLNKKFGNYQSKIQTLELKKQLFNKKNLLKESNYRKKFFLSPILNQTVKKGTKFSKKMVTYVKKGNKNPIKLDILMKKKFKFALKKNEIISNYHFNRKFAAIIIVRLNSSRLRNKALKKIDKFASIQLLIKRVKKLKNISNIILATSPNKNLSKLRKISEMEKINFFVGSENNVLKRIIRCAEKFKVDSVIRVTGDDIFRDIEKLDRAILSHEKHNKDITIMKNIPYGLDSEIFNLDVLKIIEKKMNKKCDSGYLSWFIDDKVFNVNKFDCKYYNCKDIVITLDYKIDLVIMKFITKNLGIYFTTDELIYLYKKYKKKFKFFKSTRDKLVHKYENFHHPIKANYKLNI